MPTLLVALLLAAVLSLLCTAIQTRVAKFLHRRPARVWGLPVVLTAVFSAAALFVHAWTLPLTVAVLAYTAAPVLCAWTVREQPRDRPALADFAAILLLWLPLEFSAGARMVPRAAQGYLHTVAYAIAILLALLLFAAFRSFPGLKYNLPRERRDYWLPLIGFAAAAPILIILGFWIGFIPAPHGPLQRPAAMAEAVPVIFFGTALPEEILFRSLIQNLLMRRFGASWRTLLAASVIFGCAHLDNGPQPLPNWRYAIVATVAGVAYGAVFQRASTVLSSAALHAMVDWTKHYFF
ncbi:MAG TPA: type II CAAX endopeptidase family protein [Bryobacteraceae bacterium]|nr:type II CAAX endopeptidase family protein [Bryobacteraceae bacterium]